MSEKMSIEEYKEKMEELFDECEKVLAQFKGDKLAELKESKKEGKWKPKEGEMYWFRNINGFRDWDTWIGKAEDNFRYNNIPIFPTQPACERYWHFMDTVKEKSYSFSKEEWEDSSIKKYIIYYNCANKIIETIGQIDVKSFGEVHFKTREDAQYIIDNFKEELMEYWL